MNKKAIKKLTVLELRIKGYDEKAIKEYFEFWNNRTALIKIKNPKKKINQYKGGKYKKIKVKKEKKPRIFSYGEQRIEEILISYNIKYKREKEFKWLLGVNYGRMRLDFYLPDLKLAIEYDGSHHLTDEYVIANDRKKDNLLAEHNIDLLRIPSKNYKQLEEIILNKIKSLTQELSGISSDT